MTSRSKPKRYIECPFCSGVLEPKIGKMKCPECHTKFEYDDRMESIFVDTRNLRLPIHGTVCPRCGLVQGEDGKRCVYCGEGMSGTVQ
jgi:hypothetical protein